GPRHPRRHPRRRVRRRDRAPCDRDGRRRDRRRRADRRRDRRVARVRAAGREDPRAPPLAHGRTARTGRRVRRLNDMTAVRIGPRTIVALGIASVFGVVSFFWPFFVTPGSALGTSDVAPLIFGGLLLLVLAVVLAQVSEGGLDAKALALLGVLSALGA